VQLGRLRATQAVEPITRLLSSDRSPVVREAAARGLGLIGSPASLPALQQAAQADQDREVRASARFAVDVIQSRK
jgi:HEAT repeat protein